MEYIAQYIGSICGKLGLAVEYAGSYGTQYEMSNSDLVLIRLINVREPKIYKYDRKFEKIPFFPVFQGDIRV